MTDDLQVIDDIPVVDRSTLERWASCPMRGRLSETICRSAGVIAATGDQVHRAISETVTFYVDAFDKFPSRLELKEYFLTRLRESRPDVQPDALSAGARTAWAFAEYLCELAPKNILAYDGGEGVRSGQLAIDLNTVPVRATAELDLLHATASKEVLQNVDYKSGWKPWTVEDVRQSFQFTLHAVLAMHKYPDVRCVRTSVWDFRRNRLSYAVEFERDDFDEYAMRIETAASQWYRWNVLQPTAEPPAWPARDKCDTCSCVSRCTFADADLTEDPAASVDQLNVIELKASAIRERLTKVVKETGKDIVSPGGLMFGFGKPKSSRAPSADLWTPKGN